MSKVIDKPGLDQLLASLLGEGLRLIAPVRQGRRTLFAPVARTSDIEHGTANTDLPPKEYLFPRTELIAEFSGEGASQVVRGIEPEAPATVLFGVRPCDAAAIEILRLVFADGIQDTFFLRRHNSTTIISIACTEPQPWCFCTAVGYGPSSTLGSDLLLTPVGGDIMAVTACSDKGAALVERFATLFEDDPSVDTSAAAAAAEGRISRTGNLLNQSARLLQGFSDETWEEVGRACLSCGACAYCCPTCHCFDIVDEDHRGGGSRLKIWDCCAFPVFTLHASGHNPRPEQPARYRQRLLHKLAYFPQRYGHVMCVGCGRCLLRCPAGQDIYEAAMTLVSSEAAPAHRPEP